MSVSVTINGARRIQKGPMLMVDVTVGTSHQHIAFSEQDLLSFNSLQAQIDYIVAQAVASATTESVWTEWPDGLANMQSTTSATGSNPMASFGVAERTSTASDTYTATDYLILWDATSGNLVATLPTAVGNAGQQYVAKKIDSSANTVTVTPDGSEKIDGASTKVLTIQYQSITLTSNNVGWVIS